MHGLVRLERGTYPGEHPGWSHVSYPTPVRAEPGAAGSKCWRTPPARRMAERLGIASARIDYSSDEQRACGAVYLHTGRSHSAVLFVAPVWRLRRDSPVPPSAAPPASAPAAGYNLTANVSGVCPECGRRRVT